MKVANISRISSEAKFYSWPHKLIQTYIKACHSKHNYEQEQAFDPPDHTHTRSGRSQGHKKSIKS